MSKTGHCADTSSERRAALQTLAGEELGFLGAGSVSGVVKQQSERPLRAAGQLRPRRCRALCSARL